MQINIEHILYPSNYLNTPLTDKLLERIDKDSKGELFEWFEKVYFIKNLISPDRRKISDMPKDKYGKVIVDFENPHILENMDYFRPAALYYEKHGCYTHLYPNPNPSSDYRKFWDEERRRCIEGYVREDGEWIPGYFYAYLNYCRIQKVKLIDGNRAERVEGFPDIWDGDYFFYHYVERGESDGEHGSILKCRGRGYSFKGGNMAQRNYHHIKKSKSFLFASETEFLTRDGIASKAWDNINFIDNNTPFTQPRDYKDTEMLKRASYKDIESRTEKGWMSEVMAVTCKDDPDKGRGKRGKLLFFDESGVFPGLEKVWGVARKSVEQGRSVFGYMLSAGTGGTLGADFEAAERLFYKPGAYNVKKLKNVFDKTAGVGECSLFIPEYLNRDRCYDKNGNSDVIKALIEILEQREKIRKSSTDSQVITQEKAESPVTPQEAVMRIEGSIFPIADLKDYLSDIMPNLQKFVSPHYVGKLMVKADGRVVFAEDLLVQPLRDFPIKDNTNKEGAIEIFVKPVLNSEGKTTKFRYIGGIDPIDDDHSTTNSLPSIFIFDTFTDRIVAEFTGRLRTADEFYEVCRRLLIYYGATANYENDKKGLYGYFYRMHSLHLLCDNPEILEEKGLSKVSSNYGNKKKGTNSGKEVNIWGRRLQRDWMLKAVVKENEDEEVKLNLHNIRSIGYLKELIAWNPDGNFDRVSAMGMLMIYREDLRKVERRITEKKVKTLRDDPFWTRFNKFDQNRINYYRGDDGLVIVR